MIPQARKKVLFLITQAVSGGAQRYVFDLATNLDKGNYEVAVAAGGDGELIKRLESAGFKTFKLKWLKRPICPACDIKAYFEIKRLLKNWQPDILHLNSSKAGILGSLAARRLPIKVIYTVHGAVFEASFSFLAKKLFLYLEKWTAKYKHKIVCVSENDRALWLKYKVAPIEKLITIHNGIDFNTNFLPKEEARQELLSECRPELFSAQKEMPKQVRHDTMQDYKIIGTIAHLYPEKNLETLIETANLIIKNPIETQEKILFIVIGSGPMEKSLRSKVQSLELQEKIIFLGAISDTAKYLKAFDIFVLPSIKEGLPYTILEAMAAGLPIIASRVGGIPEMIENEVNGFLISAKDHEALAARIVQVLENPALAQKFSQNSLEKIKEFSLERMIQKTQEQY